MELGITLILAAICMEEVDATFVLILLPTGISILLQ